MNNYVCVTSIYILNKYRKKYILLITHARAKKKFVVLIDQISDEKIRNLFEAIRILFKLTKFLVYNLNRILIISTRFPVRVYISSNISFIQLIFLNA